MLPGWKRSQFGIKRSLRIQSTQSKQHAKNRNEATHLETVASKVHEDAIAYLTHQKASIIFTEVNAVAPQQLHSYRQATAVCQIHTKDQARATTKLVVDALRLRHEAYRFCDHSATCPRLAEANALLQSQPYCSRSADLPVKLGICLVVAIHHRQTCPACLAMIVVDRLSDFSDTSQLLSVPLRQLQCDRQR